MLVPRARPPGGPEAFSSAVDTATESWPCLSNTGGPLPFPRLITRQGRPLSGSPLQLRALVLARAHNDDFVSSSFRGTEVLGGDETPPSTWVFADIQ